jgi:hypothetical protein
MKNKRGALEVQFNWVFVMVAGALILVFFFGIVQKQRELSNAKIADSLLTNIESIATGAAVSTGTVQPVALPNVGVNFGCTEECLCTYSIGDVRKEYSDKIIFAPELVKGSEMILWTLDWKVPFRATNFIYATTRNDKYFFIYDKEPQTALLKRINKTLPPEVNSKFVFIDQLSGLKQKIRNENYNSAKFILVDTTFQLSPQSLQANIDSSFRKTDVSVVHITTGGGAVFYDKASERSLEFNEAEQLSYYGEPSMYGAIFAADSGAYKCNMISALIRLQHILDLYIERADYLNENTACSIGLDKSLLIQLKGTADTVSKETHRISELNTPVSAVQSQNEQLLRASCALLY